MTDPATTPPEPDADAEDDAIAEALADEVLARIMAAHPQATPAFRKKLVRLYMRQATGRESCPGKISQRALGSDLHLTYRRVSQIEADALAKLRHHRHALVDLYLSRHR